MDSLKLVEAIEGADLRDVELKARSYSGRGMFGRKCVGVEIGRDVSTFQLAAAIAAALLDADAEEGPSDVEALARLRVSEDNMGLDTIVYFPQVEWPTDDLGDEDHDCEGPSCCTPA